jgi:hypothetical protein
MAMSELTCFHPIVGAPAAVLVREYGVVFTGFMLATG